MKKIIFKLTTIAFFLTPFMLTANSSLSLFSFEDSDDRAKKIILDLSAFDANKISCQIIDANGFKIFSDKLNVSERGLQAFNLNQLDQGEYTFVVNDLMKVVRYNVDVTRDFVLVDDTAEVIYKPTVWLDNDKADFHLFAREKPVSIEIFNEDGRKVYKRQYDSEMVVSKRLDLSQLDSGTFTMKVKVEDEVFFKYLRV